MNKVLIRIKKQNSTNFYLTKIFLREFEEKKDKLKDKQWFKLCFELINTFLKSVILKCDFAIKKFLTRAVSSDETMRT